MRTAPCRMLQSLGEDAVDTELEPIMALDVGAEGCHEDHVSHLPLAAAERHRRDDLSHHERRRWQRNFPSGLPGISMHSPYLACQLSTEYAWQSTEGYPAMVDLSVGVRIIRNRMVT